MGVGADKSPARMKEMASARFQKKIFEYFLFLANFILLLMTTLCVPNGMSLKWLNVDALIWGIYGQLDILKIGIYFK